MDGASSGSHPNRPHSRHSADISAHRSKRSHAQMSGLNPPHRTNTNHDTTSAPQAPPSPQRNRLVLPPLSPSIRSPSRMDLASSSHPRRGFDYRRPTSTSVAFPRPDVVDLTADDEANDDMDTTEEQATSEATSIFASAMVHEFNRPGHQQQRLPRFGRPIIDLSERLSPPRTAASSGNSSGSRRESRRALYREDRITPGARQGDLFEDLVEPRRNRVGRPRPSSYAEPPTPSPPRRPQSMQVEIDLTNSSDALEDDVIFVSSRSNPQMREPARPAGRHSQRRPSDMETIVGLERVLADPNRTSMLRRMLGSLPVLGRYHTSNMSFDTVTRSAGQFMQPNMNYNSAGFELGIDRSSATPQPPAYQPPAPAADGFTRNPAKSEDVVCPSCGDELAQGVTEEKRQVWVVKSCGHVYCGQCIAHRSKTKAKAMGKARAQDVPSSSPPCKPFSECVVHGCSSKVHAKTSVFQIFL